MQSLIAQINSLLGQLEFAKVSVTIFYGWLINNFELHQDIEKIVSNIDNSSFFLLSEDWKKYFSQLYFDFEFAQQQNLRLDKYGSPHQIKYYLAIRESVFTTQVTAALTLFEMPNLSSKVEKIAKDWIIQHKSENLYLGPPNWHLIGWKDIN